MIRPEGFTGVVFGEASDGDPRNDHEARREFSQTLGISQEWVLIDQVHGSRIVSTDIHGHHGEADGVFTSTPSLPIAVATADCVPVVLVGNSTIAVVHAGWRGVAAGVVEAAYKEMMLRADDRIRGVIGPHIGPCCYEVGGEVIDALGGFASSTKSGEESVDLREAVRSRIPEVELAAIDVCTKCDSRFNSYRENATTDRQVTVAWIAQDF